MRDESQCVNQTGGGEDIHKNSKERSHQLVHGRNVISWFYFLYYGRGDLSAFSPSQLSLFLFFPSRRNTPPFSFSQCLEEHFFPSELFFLLLNQFPCVISMHGSSSPRVR